MDSPEEIGRRIRELRQRQELSLRGLARKADVAVSFLSKVETGRGSPTLATLFKLLEALGTGAPEFFSDAEAGNDDVVIRRRVAMRAYDDGDKACRFLFPNHPAVQTVMTYEQYRPGTRNVERERHSSDVCGMVLSGALTIEAAGRPPMIVRKGDSFYIKAGTPHTATNQGKGLLRLVAVELRRPR